MKEHRRQEKLERLAKAAAAMRKDRVFETREIYQAAKADLAWAEESTKTSCRDGSRCSDVSIVRAFFRGWQGLTAKRLPRFILRDWLKGLSEGRCLSQLT